MADTQYELRYLPLFYEDLEQKVIYISETLHNEKIGNGNGYPSSSLTWRTPSTEEPGGLQSTGSQRVRHE